MLKNNGFLAVQIYGGVHGTVFYLKNIELFHFRKFDNAVYEFNPRMNVVIGKNASGKTTVLEAATVILGAYLTAFKEYVPSRFGHNISDSDVLKKSLKPVKNVAVTASVQQYPCKITSQFAWDKSVETCTRGLEKGSDFSVKMTVHIHRLFEKFGFDEVFGRSAGRYY